MWACASKSIYMHIIKKLSPKQMWRVCESRIPTRKEEPGTWGICMTAYSIQWYIPIINPWIAVQECWSCIVYSTVCGRACWVCKWSMMIITYLQSCRTFVTANISLFTNIAWTLQPVMKIFLTCRYYSADSLWVDIHARFRVDKKIITWGRW
jgi:hypothetical protein